MKITFECNIIYDDFKKAPSIMEALMDLQEGEVNVEIIPVFFNKPTIILTKKK